MNNNSSSPYSKNISEKDFDQDVIQQSFEKLVLVDFWAGWCNPCNMLAPILEAVINEYKGEVQLIKVDTDKEKNLAAGLEIRSLPTVIIFKQGEIVNKFTGVIPEADIKTLIETHRINENDVLYLQAQKEYEGKNLESAIEPLDKILAKDDSYINAKILLARIYLQQKKFSDVDNLLHHISMRNADNPQIKEILALNSFYQDIPEGETSTTLKEKVENEDSIERHYQLACVYAAEENYELALEEFLEVMKRDRKYKEDRARKNMLTIFEILGSAGPLVNTYRIKMARLLH